MASDLLAAFAEIVMGQSPPGEACNTEGIGLPLLNGPTEYGPHHPSPVQFTTDARKRARPGDILFCVRGSTTGRMNWADREYAIGRGVAAVRHRNRVELQPFVRAVIDYELPGLLAQATGSTFPNISANQLAGVTWPPIPETEQRAIAHVLGTLDDKIELNRRMSETLETMARALFKSWFVDFDPVRAKCRGEPVCSPQFGQVPPSGHTPHLGHTPQSGQTHRSAPTKWPQHILDLFPDRLVDSELGEIPEGWKVGTLGNAFTVTMGQSPPGNTYNEIGEGLPFYQGRADFTSRFPNRRVYCTTPTRLAKAEDTLISVRAPVGDINMASEDCAIGRGVAAALHNTGSRSYTYQFMHGLKDVFGCFEAEGTVFGSIGTRDFHVIPCVIAPDTVIAAFERLCSPVDGQIESKDRESRTLSALRDTLLPNLISGELRIKDVDRILAGAGT